MAYIEIEHYSKVFGSGEREIRANDDISFELEKGQLMVIVGASGAGKSTLLNTLGGMDSATEGRVEINGKNIAEYSEKQLTTYRRNSIGFVFQFYNLIPNLTTLENVELASEISPDALDPAETLAKLVWKIGKIIFLHSFRVENSKELQSHARLQKIQNFCCAMSQRGRLIIRQAKRFYSFYKISATKRAKQLLLSLIMLRSKRWLIM